MDFDLRLARECAENVSIATGLGCALTDAEGELIQAFGTSCGDCALCRLAGKSAAVCRDTRRYGMRESERFGGRYIYFCAMGLTFFTSPILGPRGGEAQLTVGPFLMVDAQDWAACELGEGAALAPDTYEAMIEAAKRLPYVEARRVTALSDWLFMGVSFIQSVSQTNRMLEAQQSERMLKGVTAYIDALKRGGEGRPYPYGVERRFLQALGRGDRALTQKLLNELLGSVFFFSGGDPAQIRDRLFELLVLMSRAAAEQGRNADAMLRNMHEYRERMADMENMDALCAWISGIVREYMEDFFTVRHARYSDQIHWVILYLQTHYAEKVTLEEVARGVCMSPTYLSRLFRRETGETLTCFLQKIRVEKCKEMLLRSDARLIDVALVCGFESQSYFCRVFRQTTGVTPRQYRKNRRGEETDKAPPQNRPRTRLER